MPAATDQAAGGIPTGACQRGDDASIREQSAFRYAAWLRNELDLLPAGHPLHTEFSCQLRMVLHRRQVRPAHQEDVAYVA